ncbi:hypothetical protein BCR42DRAFT_421163 [Absidia repens]|uniref:Uncharacterized protein n=1 Tax=Absidia repens TaxID=90262 RepID=A0A1X2I8E4_9FUNG|nr:hypothetical protein BCR42DRAFT_421163 [Absidia repens]
MLSLECKKLNLDLRLDFRAIVDTEQDELEALTGEIASARTTTASKLYKDRLKSTKATQCHQLLSFAWSLYYKLTR